ncbi:MAG: hypothetical protein FWE18_03380 [Alphaproteobacteria bacterium]|nr:hypothetical protein [Alphaproteobacteria bacterium]
MRKIIFAIVFSFFSANLMAQGDNSIIVGFGGANNKVQVSQRSTAGQFPNLSFSPFTDEPGFDATSNFNLAYLKSTNYLNGKLSIGADFTMLFNKGLNNKETYIFNTAGTAESVIKDKSSLYSYTIMFLANYELLSISAFDVSAQLGLGFILNTLDLNFTNTVYDGNGNVSDSVHITGNGTSGSGAARIGLVGNYNMFDRLAIGAGAYYLYAGETKKSNLAGTGMDYKFRNNGTVLYNIHVIWRF